MEAILLIPLAGAYITSIVVCFRKGKPVFGWLGIAGAVIFPVIALLGWFPVIGAVRIAKPDSGWANSRYSPEQRTAALRRFPFPVTPASAPGHEPVSDQSRRAGEALIIKSFLTEALDRGVIQESAYRRLRQLLDNPALHPQEAQPAPSSPPPPEMALVGTDGTAPPAAGKTTPTVGTTPPASLDDEWTAVTEAVAAVRARREALQPPVRPPRATPPSRSIPDAPAPIPTHTRRLAGLREAISSDLSIHGFAYLGVLLTFVGVLGFLLFAFKDFPTAAQPFVELAIVLVFFGWAWLLRRQKANVMASAMELMGGMILPLVLFAALVDGAPVPPDFEGGDLVMMMTVSCLALAGAYHWIARRNPSSILRALVAPLVWLAAMTAGFVFKGDEPLRSDAITRPVSYQPALASVAIAATLAVARLKPRHPLAGPTVRSGLVGVLVAYILTVSLSVGEGWESTTPLVMLGAATFLSVEFLGRWYGRLEALAAARPVLLAGVLVPLVPSWGTAWTGLAGTVAYLALTEFGLRARDGRGLATSMSAGGALASALVSIAEPWAALASFTIASIWVHVRRVQAGTPPSWVGALTVAAALLPVAAGRSLLELLEPGWAWLVMAAIVLVVSAGVRYRGIGDEFWSYWVMGAAVAVAAISYRTVAPSRELTTALTVSTVTVGLAPYRLVLRVWLGVGLGALALGSALADLDLAPAWEAAPWAAAGLLLVTAATVWGGRPSGHLALAGHLVGTTAALLPSEGWGRVGVLGLLAAGWVVSTTASERGRASITGVLRTAAESAGVPAEVAATAAARVAPVAAVITAPVALLAAANRFDEFAAHRAWAGLVVAAIALVYALIARNIRSRSGLGRVLAVGSTVAAVLGVSVAAPDEWPTVLAAAAVIGVALLLDRDRRVVWFAWYSWFMSGVVVVTGAAIAGVDVDDLHLAALAWGGALMVGGLLVDDIQAGRRQLGEWLRVPWTRYPVVIGALATPLALSPVFSEQPSVLGWWALGVAGLYLLVAYLTRLGAVTGPAFALVAVGAVALSPWPLLDPSWRLVVISAGLVLVAWGADRLGGSDADPWHRWDLGPLVVSHVVGVVALVYAMSQDHQLFATAGAFGLLTVAVGLWKGRAWIEAGNAMAVLSAWDMGPDWLALALVATGVRAAAGVARTTGATRTSYQLIGIASTGAAWVVFADVQAWLPAETVAYSALLFGALALAIAALTRWWSLGRDTTLWWGSTSLLAFLVIGINIRDPSATGIIDGPWLALGLAMLAASLQVVASSINPALRKLTAPISGLSWLALTAGLQWSVATFVAGTSLVFGALLVTLLEGLRHASRRAVVEETAENRISLVRVWVAFGMAGVTVAGLLALIADVDAVVWRGVAAGLAMAAVAMARGASPLRLSWMRPATTVTALASLNALGASFEVPASAVTAGALAVAVTASLFTLVMWRVMPESAWLGSLGTLGIAANLEAAGAWPVSGQDRRSLVALLVSLGIGAVASGLAARMPLVLGLAPPLAAGAFIVGAAESASGDPQWFTIPLALVLLSEVEILAWASRRRDTLAASTPTIVLEWAGVGLLAAPPLVEMFITGPSRGVTGFAMAALIFGWALVTRIRRRAIFAASVAVATAILLLFSAATAAAPVSAFFWIVSVGIGFTVMVVAGMVEAYRSRRGHIMLRIDQLMEGWE